MFYFVEHEKFYWKSTKKTADFPTQNVYKLKKMLNELIWLRIQTEKDKLPTVTTLYLNHYNNDPFSLQLAKA